MAKSMNQEEKIIKDVDNWELKNHEYRKYRLNTTLKFIGFSIILISFCFITFSISDCAKISCENSNKYHLEKQKLDFQQNQILQKQFKEENTKEIRDLKIKDCEKLKEMTKNLNDENHTNYLHKYNKSCIDILVMD